MKKFISAICVIALMMPSTLSAFADAGTADNLSGQQAVVVDVADSTEDAAETETETVVETESASVVSTEKASDTKATSDTSKASETETMDETEDEPEVDPQYADDPQYWKEMKKQYGVATMSAVPSGIFMILDLRQDVRFIMVWMYPVIRKILIGQRQRTMGLNLLLSVPDTEDGEGRQSGQG